MFIPSPANKLTLKSLNFQKTVISREDFEKLFLGGTLSDWSIHVGVLLDRVLKICKNVEHFTMNT